ncbi:unnamed protein product [Callosobruchus maculatus]|uniref:Major facilitator superfamily (MFS) profile domain-containing protein n=1 Tax=Callosobruchus maculatus TaxID=64391 RepID=A0A653CAP8_CALMS|nr:unnamed protein product [Callosobruchus maculatus]
MSKKCEQSARERMLSGGNRAPVYAAGVAVCVGAICNGIALAWTTNISKKLEAGQLNGIIIEQMDLHWIGVMMTIGCCVATIPIAIALDTIGRKPTMLIATLPLYVGYTLIVFARHKYIIFVARLIIGLGVSGFSCCCPLYASEIAHKSIRGRVVSFYFMFVSIGFLYANVFGWLLPIKLFVFACLIVPVIFTAMFFFQPKSPVHEVQTGRIHQAISALKALRGSNYDFTAELKHIKLELARNAGERLFFGELKDKAVLRCLFISNILLLLKYLVGAAQVLTFTSEVVKSCGFSDAVVKWSVVIAGLIRAAASFIPIIYIDRLGRRLFLVVGFSITFVSTALLGVYYTFYDRKLASPRTLDMLEWIPLISLAFYWAGYSAGIGNVACMTAVEIFPADIRARCKCITELFNWSSSVVVATVYVQMGLTYGWDTNWYCYSFFSLVGIVIAIFVYPEATMKDTHEVFEEIAERKHIFRSYSVEPILITHLQHKT